MTLTLELLNMTEDVIERYVTFNIKGCTHKRIFGGFNDLPILYIYYNLLNVNDDDDNKIPGTPVDNILPDN